MSHSVVYPGDFAALLKKWAEQKTSDQKANAPMTFIENGQCARLPQALTPVGHTSRWQPGERVVDVRNLAQGTVIANFMFSENKAWYPNEHGFHAALFVKAEGHSIATGKPSQIWMFDQWATGTKHPPGPRAVRALTSEYQRRLGIRPCDNANEFYVVMVP